MFGRDVLVLMRLKVAAKKSVRGKKGKLKKMKKKYADQDEEERRIKMELLASVPREKEAFEKPKDRDPNIKAIDVRELRADRIKETAEPQMPEQATADAEETMSNDDVDDDGPKDDEMPASYLDSLTGNPLSEDVLLFFIPVCGPYTALQN